MASLQEIMDLPQAPAPSDRGESPRISIDFDNKETQIIRFRFLKDLMQMDHLIRHYVPELRRFVMCNQMVGMKELKDKAGKKTGKKELTLWSHGWDKNQVRTPHCRYCEAKSVARKAAMEIAIANGETALSKEEGTEIQGIYKRQLVLVAPVQAELKDGEEVVKPLGSYVMFFAIYDLYFNSFNAQWKALKSKFDNKKTLLKHWFILNGEGTIDLDDPLDKKELAEVIPAPDEDYFRNETLSYEEGEALMAAREAEADKATPKAQAKVEPKAESKVVEDEVEDDGTIPF